MSSPPAIGFIIAAAAGLWLGLFADVMLNGVPFRSFIASAFAIVGGATGAVAARPPRVPWWKRKWFWAATVMLWLLTGYVLSIGPLSYAEARGWLRNSWGPALAVLYQPLRSAMETSVPMSEYIDWCQDLGRAHRRDAGP